MLLLPSKVVPRGEGWLYELKFDGFRGIAIKSGESVRLISRNRKDLAKRFPGIVSAVAKLRCRTAILDGEIVALDSEGRPCFEDLQNARPTKQKAVFFYCFDLMHLNGRNLCTEPLLERKQRLQAVLAGSASDLRFSDALEADPDELVNFCRENRLEGIVAKKCYSRYDPGKRSGAWTKFKTYQTGTFVVGGFRLSDSGFSSLAVGFRRGGQFRFAGKIECHWHKEQKLSLCQQFLGKIVPLCPFESIPKRQQGDTWNAGLTIEEFKEFAWVKPSIEVRVRFLEWTRARFLRQAALDEASK